MQFVYLFWSHICTATQIWALFQKDDNKQVVNKQDAHIRDGGVSERNLKHQDSGEIEIATPVRLATDPLQQPWLSPNAMQPRHLWVQVQILLTSVLKSCVKPETRTVVADVVTSTVFKWHFQQSGVDIPVNCSGKKRRQILIEGRLWYF